MADVGRNRPCPCGKMKKYKKCCFGKVPWEILVDRPLHEVAPYLSTRGKNLLFLKLVAQALGFDQAPARDAVAFKRAFTSTAIRQIFASIMLVWPSIEDLTRALSDEADTTTGLYVGVYEPSLISAALTRHSLYADRILLVDPLVYPLRMREQYDPLLHPDMYRAICLKWVNLWLALYPWIDAGLVGIVRTPGDFDPSLEAQALMETETRFRNHFELDGLRSEDANRMMRSGVLDRYKKEMVLSIPDEAFREQIKSMRPEFGDAEIDAIMKHIQRERDADPYFAEPLDVKGTRSQLMHMSSGTNYAMAKYTAAFTGSFLMTDMLTRWREIELDRESSGIDPMRWSPFAKAFQGVPFKYLNNVPLRAALTLREEGHLEELRSFLRKAWKVVVNEDPYDPANALSLGDELSERVREAQNEWERIDDELLRWFGSELALVAGPAIAAGAASWLGAAAVTAGLTNLYVAGRQRARFLNRYPAGFLLRLMEGEFDGAKTSGG